MVRHVDAIFSKGALRPLEPLELPEGTRVRLRVEEDRGADPAPTFGKIHSPKLARPQEAADFVVKVWETGEPRV